MVATPGLIASSAAARPPAIRRGVNTSPSNHTHPRDPYLYPCGQYLNILASSQPYSSAYLRFISSDSAMTTFPQPRRSPSSTPSQVINSRSPKWEDPSWHLRCLSYHFLPEALALQVALWDGQSAVWQALPTGNPGKSLEKAVLWQCARTAEDTRLASRAALECDATFVADVTLCRYLRHGG